MYATIIGKDYGKPVQGTDTFKFSEKNKSPCFHALIFVIYFQLSSASGWLIIFCGHLGNLFTW